MLKVIVIEIEEMGRGRICGKYNIVLVVVLKRRWVMYERFFGGIWEWIYNVVCLFVCYYGIFVVKGCGNK